MLGAMADTMALGSRIAAAGGVRWLGPSRVALRVWAPNGERVRVQFEGGRVVELAPEPEQPEYWSGLIDAVAPGDRYRLALRSRCNDCYAQEGDELLRRDPYAREVAFDSEWCTLVESGFSGRPLAGQPFAAPRFNELLLYELHVGSFGPSTGEGSAFVRAAGALGHVAELGFNAISLMPVTEFGGMWGYNPRQLLAVHGPWGSSGELKHLVDRAHGLGLAVIIDLVLNHGSARLNSLWNWDGYGRDGNGGIYFEGERDTPWGRRFAFHKRPVRDYLLAACRMWFEEYKADGLRFDSVHNMPWALLPEMTAQLKADYPEKFLVAEVTPENPKVVSEAGFDACWVHAAHFDSLKVIQRRGGGEDGHRRLSLLRSMLDMHPGFPRSCSGINSLLGSHDQCGDRHGGHDDGGIHRYYVARLGGRDNWHARAQVRMGYALAAVARGLPMIFMGTETLQDAWWHVDAQHRFDWRLVAGDLYATQMMRCVRDANALRLARCSLTSENIRFVHQDADNAVLGWVRWADAADPRKTSEAEEALLCVANLGQGQWEQHDYLLQTGWGGHRRWRCVFNSQDEPYGGWKGSGPLGELQSEGDGRLRLSLPKWSAVVLELLP